MAHIIFAKNHSFYLTVVYSKLLLTNFVVLFCYFFYVKQQFLLVVNWEVNIDCEEAHESQHYLLLQTIVQYLIVNYWQFQLSSCLITFIQLLLYFFRKIVMSRVKVVDGISERIHRSLRLLLLIKYFFDWLAIIE